MTLGLAALLAFIVGASAWSLFIIGCILFDFYAMWKQHKEFRNEQF